MGQYWYDDQDFRVRRISVRDDRKYEIVYPSKYFCIEVQREVEGGKIADSYNVVNNVFLNGVRISVKPAT